MKLLANVGGVRWCRARKEHKAEFILFLSGRVCDMAPCSVVSHETSQLIAMATIYNYISSYHSEPERKLRIPTVSHSNLGL